LCSPSELARKVLEGEITNLDDLNSVLRSMIKDVVETAMGAEMTGFLGYDRYQTPDSDPGNRRNGYSQKELASKVGPIVIDVPRDRKSEFAPAIVKKRHKDIGGFEELILSMYAKGMSTRDIQHHVKEIYNHDISPETVSRITDAVIDKAKEWQNRPLEPIYAIVFMDALFLKLRVDGRVKNVAAYLMVGIDLEGKKECLGIWLGQSESAKYWLSVLNEFKNRGVNDVLIFAVDGLTGFPSGFSPAFDQRVGPGSFLAEPDTVTSATGDPPGGFHLGSQGAQHGWLGPWGPDWRGRFDHGSQRRAQDHRAPGHGRELSEDAPAHGQGERNRLSDG